MFNFLKNNLVWFLILLMCPITAWFVTDLRNKSCAESDTPAKIDTLVCVESCVENALDTFMNSHIDNRQKCEMRYQTESCVFIDGQIVDVSMLNTRLWNKYKICNDN